MSIPQRWKKIVISISLRMKLILLFILVILITSGTITVLSYRATESTILLQAQKNSEAYLNQVNMRFETLMQDIHRGMLSISFNKDFVLAIANSDSMSYDSLDKLLRSQNIITTMTNTNRYINNINIYDLKNNVWFSSTRQKGRINKESADYKLIASYYRSDAPKPIYKWVETRGIMYWNNKYNVLTFLLPIDYIDNPQVNAVILCDIRQEMVAHIFSHSDSVGEVYLVDEQNTILSARHTALLGTKLQGVHSSDDISDSFRMTLQGDDYVVAYAKSEYTGWTFYSLIPTQTLLKSNVKALKNAFLLICGITALVVTLLSLMLNMQFYRTVDRFFGAIKADDGSGDVPKAYRDRKDEIGFLYNSFHNVLHDKKSLLRNVYDQKLLLKEAEIRLLHSQINSHFLYNTLDSVVWMAKAKDYEKIVTMVSTMVRFFRISLDRGNELVTVERAIEQIDSYFTIQQMRYMDRLTVNISVAPEILQYRILKFLLQPIVENAVQHGIEKKVGPGCIDVKGWRDNGLLRFTVRDDGVGISQDKLDEVNRRIREEEQEKTFYALQNINRRIRLFYGEQYSLGIISIEGEGTLVNIAVPMLEGQEELHD